MNSTDYLGDREILSDILNSERHILSSYNNHICEATSQPFRLILENILSDTHHLHSEVWDTMLKNGWYRIRSANSQDVEMLKKKFQQIAEEL
jgi:spore coat protein F